jgi:hypothetical protein
LEPELESGLNGKIKNGGASTERRRSSFERSRAGF